MLFERLEKQNVRDFDNFIKRIDTRIQTAEKRRAALQAHIDRVVRNFKRFVALVSDLTIRIEDYVNGDKQKALDESKETGYQIGKMYTMKKQLEDNRYE